ncbi:MAG: primase C-terminal domain-containing protein [Pirellulaceae bacterium]
MEEQQTSPKAAQIEIYDHKRFWCMTGCVVPGFETVADGQQALDELVKKRTPPPRGATSPALKEKRAESVPIRFAPSNTYELMLLRARQYVAKAEPKGEGQRNMAAFSLAGNLAAFITEDTHERLTMDHLTELVESWNANNSPPLEAWEIKLVIESVLNSDTPREDKVVKVANPKRTKDESGSVVLEEIDIENIIRPERIVLPELSGVGVPTKVRTDDGIQTRHVLYLRWADGRREQRPLEQILTTDKATYFVQPYPPTSETATGARVVSCFANSMARRFTQFALAERSFHASL